jgi:hypothetical protein
MNDGWMFTIENLKALNDTLAASDWEEVFSSDDVDSATEYFYSTVYSAFDRCFPKRFLRSDSRTYPIWFSRELIQRIRAKHRSHKRWKRTSQLCDYDEFRRLCKTVKELSISCHRGYHDVCGNELIRDPRTFWTFLNSKRSKATRPSTMTRMDRPFTNPSEIENGFAEFFQSVFVHSSIVTDELTDSSGSWPPTLSINDISTSDMRYAFRRLRPTTSSGPDLIPCHIFKGCEAPLSEPLRHIFNLGLTMRRFPTVWKYTKVTPILKKRGRKQDRKLQTDGYKLRQYMVIYCIVIVTSINDTVESARLLHAHLTSQQVMGPGHRNCS